MKTQLHAIVVGFCVSMINPIMTAAQDCEPHWSGDFPAADLNGPVTSLAFYDDGSGPALYVGGEFTTAGDLTVNRVARWDGRGWSALAGGVDGRVKALAVYDDGRGSGPMLVAAGRFTSASGVAANNIARWDGRSWSALGTGVCCGFLPDPVVWALTVFDDGTSAALIAGGDFTTAGGQPASHIASWNGVQWSPLGSGTSGSYGTVAALLVHDDGTGPALYIGGEFMFAGGVSARNIARWNGTSWSPLTSGACCTNFPYFAVHSMAELDEGSRRVLVVGGNMTTAGGAPVHGLARWDGAQWTDLGGGVAGHVEALATIADRGTGQPILFAGGGFTSAGGAAARHIAAWNGTSWSSVQGGITAGPFVHTLLPVSFESSNPVLMVGGDFTSAATVAARNLAQWNDPLWSAVGNPGNGTNDSIVTLKVFDDGNGSSLYAGGSFAVAGPWFSQFLARWDGDHWHPIGQPIAPLFTGVRVEALEVFDDGTGPALYVGGVMPMAGGLSVGNIARWDGRTFSQLGVPSLTGAVFALAASSGEGRELPRMLFAGGEISIAGGQPAHYVAGWDGDAWHALGTGVNGNVFSLAVLDDPAGQGKVLFVGGRFTIAGGQPALRFAKWDGAAWSPIAGGVSGGSNPYVEAIASFDDGLSDRPAIYLGGSFTMADGQPAVGIARWDGSRLTPLPVQLNGSVHGLAVFDDGSGPALFATGTFSMAGGQFVDRVAKWDGLTWMDVGAGISTGSTPVTATAWEDDPGGSPALYIGGSFVVVDGIESEHLAKYVGCSEGVVADLNGDGIVNTLDLGILLSQWSIPRGSGGCGGVAPCAADLNHDGTVNALDLGILLANWTL